MVTPHFNDTSGRVARDLASLKCHGSKSKQDTWSNWRPFSLVCLLATFEVEGGWCWFREGGVCCPDNTGGKILLIAKRD